VQTPLWASQHTPPAWQQPGMAQQSPSAQQAEAAATLTDAALTTAGAALTTALTTAGLTARTDEAACAGAPVTVKAASKAAAITNCFMVSPKSENQSVKEECKR